MSLSPAPETNVAPPFRASFSIPRDILIAPNRAFAAVTASGAWVTAYVTIAVLFAVSGFLEWPALAHVAASLPDEAGHVPHGAAAVAATGRTILANTLLVSTLTPLLLMSLTASLLTFVARFKGNPTRFATFFALAGACLIPSALGNLVGAIAVGVHDPASYHDYRGIFLAVPDNLGVFAAKGNEPELFFLARFGLFDIWSDALLAFGIVSLVPIRFMTAVAIAFGLGFLLSMIG